MSRSALLISILALGVMGGPVSAGTPTIEAVHPGVGQRGSEFTITFTGARLTDAQELMFYRSGLACKKVVAEDENTVRATLTAAATCPLGEHAFRLRTKGGASELRTISISPFPVIVEVEPNDTRDKAQRLKLNTTLAGVVESGDTDTVAVELKKGQRLSAEVEAIRLGGDTVVDLALAVHAPDGKMLAAADDNSLFHQDPFATVLAPADGFYTITITDTNHGGGENHRYALHIGSFIRPNTIYPVGGQAGTEISLQLLGDPVGEVTQKIALPRAGIPFEFYPSDGLTSAPTAHPFRVSDCPNVFEVEPNNDPARLSGTSSKWPIAFNGIIGQKGDVDFYRFTAKKGDSLQAEVFAYRVGSPLDSVVNVYDPTGRLLVSGDDDETHDSKVRFTAPSDGEYMIRVTDKRGQGGPGFVYRVEIEQPTPGLAVFMPIAERKSQAKQVIAVPRGNRVTTFLAVRRDGLNGEVKLSTGTLPIGVTLDAATIPAGDYLVPVTFSATADAPLGGKLVDVAGTLHDRGREWSGGFRQLIDHARGPGDSAFHTTIVGQLAVVVVDPVPLTVKVVPPATPLVADGSLEVTVEVNRGEGFAGPVEVCFPYLPPGVESPATLEIPADKSRATVTMNALPGTGPVDCRIVAEAKPISTRRRRDPTAAGGMGGGMRRSGSASPDAPPVASELVSLRLSDAVVRGSFAPVCVEQGREVRVMCDINAKTPLPTTFQAMLVGLPPRAIAEPVTVRQVDRRIEFRVTVAPTTPLGEVSSLVCELAGNMDGQPVVYRVGRGGSMKIDPPGGTKVDADGRPLSPLDALRIQSK